MAMTQPAVASNAAAFEKDGPLHDDIRLLGQILGDTVREQDGEEAFEVVEAIRRLSVAFQRKADEAAGRNLDTLLSAAEPERDGLGHSRLQLLLPSRQPRRGPPPRPPAARARARRRAAGGQPGSTASPASRARASRTDAIERALNAASCRPVLTAHPTEVQRKSTLDAERAIADLLAARDEPAQPARAGGQRGAAARRASRSSGRRGCCATDKLTVRDEIENVLSYYPSTFLTRDSAALRRPRSSCSAARVAPFFRMGNWIGGDRDGNPNVDADDPRHGGPAPRRDRAAPLSDRGA